MFNTVNIIPFDQKCSYEPYVNNWYDTNSFNIYRRMVSPYFQDDIPSNQRQTKDFIGTRVPKPCGGFWSIANSTTKDQSKLYLPKNPNESEEYNNVYGGLLTPPGPRVNLENEIKWRSSQAGRNAEIMRGFGYPTVSCGKMDPLLYNVRY